MTWEEYVLGVKRTESANFAVPDRRMLHAAMGLVTEAAELMDAIKKATFYSAALDHTNIVEEMGDLCYYLALMCDVQGISLNDVMAANAAKLRARYGAGFTVEAAAARDVERERLCIEEHCAPETMVATDVMQRSFLAGLCCKKILDLEQAVSQEILQDHLQIENARYMLLRNQPNKSMRLPLATLQAYVHALDAIA